MSSNTPSSTPTEGDATVAPAAAESHRKVWRAGTLTYTTGGLVVLFVLLLGGDFGFFLKERAVNPTVQVLLKDFEASDFVLALLVTALPQLMSLVLIPVISFRSDRCRSRWGRRIPFLAFTVPIAIVGMIGMAFGPKLGGSLDQMLGASSPGYHACVVMVLGMFWGVFEFSSVICTCLFHGLITDVVPREVIGRFYAAFRIISLAASMIFTATLLGHVQEYFAAIFLGICTIYGIMFGAMCLRVKEGNYPPPEPIAGERGVASAVRAYSRDCLSKSYYVWIYTAIAFGYMCTLPISLYIYAFAPTLGLSLDTLGKYLTLQTLLSLLQSYPLGWLADRFHPLRVNLVTLALFVVATISAFFFVHDAVSLGIAVVVVGTLAGSWATSMYALGPTLFPKATFATMNSGLTVFFSVGQLGFGLLCGWMLDRMDHEYRYIYLWAALAAIASLGATWIVYRKFLKYGGPDGYVAP